MLRIGATVGTIAGVYFTAKHIMKWKSLNSVLESFTGIDAAHGAPTFRLDNFKMLPAYVGIGVSAVAAKAKLNKYLPKGIGL